MTFLPDGRLLVSEKKGALKLLDVASQRQAGIAGVPTVAYGGQGGFGDVILHPGFADESAGVRELLRNRVMTTPAARQWHARAWRSIRKAAANSKTSR